MRKSVHYYDRDRRKGRKYSIVFHALLLLLAIFGLPEFLSPKPPEEPMAVTVEILPTSAMSNVKPSQQQPKEEEETKPNPKEAPPVNVADDEPPPPPEPSILPKPAEKPKPKPPEKPKPKPKPKQDDLAAVLKAVKDTAQKEKKKEAEQPKADDKTSQSRSNHYDPGLPMSLSEIDAIRNQIAKCWNVPAGAKNAHELVVVLRLQMAPDGSVLKVELAGNQSRYDSDNFFRAAADSARRAVQECSPLKNLPQDKYATWRDMEMTFDPKEMLF